MMRRVDIAVWMAVLASAAPLHAHRTEGLLQSALIDVQTDRVDVQVTVQLGSDIAGRFTALLDTDQNGIVSEKEQSAWSKAFLREQIILLDGKALPLTAARTDASSLADITDASHGHCQIRVHFSGEFATHPIGQHEIVHQNRYESIPSTYQTHGIVPKAPTVRITSHRRDEREQTIILQAEFRPPSMVPQPSPVDQPSPLSAILVGIAGLVFFAATAYILRRKQTPLADQQGTLR
jgi:hypothetical protein